MLKITKGFCLVLVASLAATIITIQATDAQSSPKPLVPEFTVKYVAFSFDVPPIYDIDQYTGKTIIKQDGYHTYNRSLQFTIRNQPFTPYNHTNGFLVAIYYNFRFKGTYTEQWGYYPFGPNDLTTRRYGGFQTDGSTETAESLIQTDSEYTTITVPIPRFYDIPDGVRLEVQAQALAGYMQPTDFMLAGHTYTFTGQHSDWSATQTVAIGENSTAAPLPTATPTTVPTLNPTSTTTLPTEAPTATSPNIDTQPETVPLDIFIAVTAALTLTATALTLLLLKRQRKNVSNL